MRRLRDAAGRRASALQNVSGKQYPGEQLPRWALYAHWRADGEPVWRDPALLATGARTPTPPPPAMPRGSAPRWRSGCRSIPSLIIPAYEDIALLPLARAPAAGQRAGRGREAGGPDGAGAAGARVRPGLDAPVGCVLPLRRVIRDGVRVWQSGKWFFRGGALFLVPGDSPIGLRLPLDSLPWADPDAIEPDVEPDPFAPRAPLAAAPGAARRRAAGRRHGRRRRGLPPGGAGRCR